MDDPTKLSRDEVEQDLANKPTSSSSPLTSQTTTPPGSSSPVTVFTRPQVNSPSNSKLSRDEVEQDLKSQTPQTNQTTQSGRGVLPRDPGGAITGFAGKALGTMASTALAPITIPYAIGSKIEDWAESDHPLTSMFKDIYNAATSGPNDVNKYGAGARLANFVGNLGPGSSGMEQGMGYAQNIKSEGFGKATGEMLGEQAGALAGGRLAGLAGEGMTTMLGENVPTAANILSKLVKNRRPQSEIDQLAKLPENAPGGSVGQMLANPWAQGLENVRAINEKVDLENANRNRVNWLFRTKKGSSQLAGGPVQTPFTKIKPEEIVEQMSRLAQTKEDLWQQEETARQDALWKARSDANLKYNNNPAMAAKAEKEAQQVYQAFLQNQNAKIDQTVAAALHSPIGQHLLQAGATPAQAAEGLMKHALSTPQTVEDFIVSTGNREGLANFAWNRLTNEAQAQGTNLSARKFYNELVDTTAEKDKIYEKVLGKKAYNSAKNLMGAQALIEDTIPAATTTGGAASVTGGAGQSGMGEKVFNFANGKLGWAIPAGIVTLVAREIGIPWEGAALAGTAAVGAKKLVVSGLERRMGAILTDPKVSQEMINMLKTQPNTPQAALHARIFMQMLKGTPGLMLNAVQTDPKTGRETAERRVPVAIDDKGNFVREGAW